MWAWLVCGECVSCGCGACCECERGRGSAKIKEVARSLSALQADRALLISLSGFGSRGPAPSKVQLVGERELLGLMISHKIGVSQYSIPLSFVDVGFFGRLNDDGEGPRVEAPLTGDD